MDAGDDGRWMTYDELAEARGIDRQSARRMANRSRWRRQKDNRGTVRVYVPLEQAVPARRHSSAGTSVDKPADMSAGTPADAPADITRAVGALEAAIGALRERSEADAATIAGQREQIGTLQADVARLGAERDAAAADGQGERGRREEAEARANCAEQALAGERTRADELRDRLDDLQRRLAEADAEGNDLTVETAELTAQLKQVRAEAQDAAQAAAELRQAEAAQQGRGRWARLRAAWRGE